MTAKTVVTLVIIAVLGVLLIDAVYVVHSRDRAILLEFGAVKRPDLNPGLGWKIPIAQRVLRFDGRVLTLDSEPQRYFTVEKKPLLVDSFVKWRIGDVSAYYTATSGDEARAMSILSDRVNEGLRNQIGRRTMHEVISGERDQLMQELTQALDAALASETGIDVIDVRVKRIDLPTEVSLAVFDRMNSEREIEARQYRATGQELAIGIRADADKQHVVIRANAYKEAEQIRGDGDAEATRIYAEAYGMDPDFYEFYRSINAYKTVFAEERQESWLVFDPSSEFFKFLKADGLD